MPVFQCGPQMPPNGMPGQLMPSMPGQQLMIQGMPGLQLPGGLQGMPQLRHPFMTAQG